MAGETNSTGDEQKKLDVLSNDIMVNSLRASRKTAVLVSEELEEAIIIDERYRGKYCVVFDPLDGSSNIDAGVNIGTIFGIYRIVSQPTVSILDGAHDLMSLHRHLILMVLFLMSCGQERTWLRLVTQCKTTYGHSYHITDPTRRYGSSANLVLSTGNGVNGYTLDAALGEFILTHPDVRISFFMMYCD